jgi:hypothetical protein
MPLMAGTVKWERLSGLKTPVLMLLAFTALCGGVSAGVFMIFVPAGWIVLGVLVCACLMFIAVVTDQEGVSGVRTR